MPGYDPVRDAGGSDRSSPPPPQHHFGNDSRPSSSASAYPHHPHSHYDDTSAPPRSLSGNSLGRYDGYADDETRFRRPSVHDIIAGPATVSPRSSFTPYPPSAADHGPQRHDQYYHQTHHAEPPPQPPPRRSASIADLIAVSEMSDAEHDRHREAHRWPQRHADDTTAGHGMSRSSSASGGFHAAPTHDHPSSSHSRISPHHPRQPDRSERSPSMAHLLNDGTAGALHDRPRSSSHSSIASHASHPAPPHTSQMSPLGPPSSHHTASTTGPHGRDRSLGSQPLGSSAGPYRGGSPSSIYPPGAHPQSLSTLNRGGSSPGLASSQFGHPAERARFASHSGSVGHGHLPRSASNSYAHASASSSPASNVHAHLQPSPSHRFAVPELPYSRSPETRRVPLPQSPTALHNPHPRTSLVPGPAQAWHPDDNEASPAGMPPPSMSASPRRGSLAGTGHAIHRHQPPTPGNGIPTTPGSVASLGGYPITPGSRSVPSHTPNAPYPRHSAESQAESNYFPVVEPRASSLHHASPREDTASLTSPHLRQHEHATQSARTDEVHHRNSHYEASSAAGRTPLAAERPAGSDRSSAYPSEHPAPIYDAAMHSNDDAATHPHSRRQSIAEDGDRPFSNGRHRRESEPTYDHSEPEHRYDRNRRTPASTIPGYDDLHDAKAGVGNSHAISHPSTVPSPKRLGHEQSEEADWKVERREANGPSSARPSSRHDTASENEESRVAKGQDHSAPSELHDDASEKAASVRAPEGQETADSETVSHAVIEPFPRYAPTRRVSQPRQVMRPIGIEEIDRKRAQCRNPLRREWERQHQTDSREPLDGILRDFMSKLERSSGRGGDPASRDPAAVEAKKRAIGETLEDAEEVADHYNKRREVGIHGREESPIIALRKFNNWVKSVLVGTFARGRDPHLDGRARARGGRVLDLGCGKGGDLKKWEKVRPSGLVGADIAAVSIEQAIARHQESNRGFPGDFFAFDCFSKSLADVIPLELLEPMFDNVTLQFCMHYAWESVDKARIMLDNVARYLRKGGTFIGTIPDSRELRDRMAASRHPEDRSFGNRYYKVIFDQTESWPAFGNRYTFFLEDAVENVPEYVVDFDVFEELAYQAGLRCIYRKNFAEIYHEGSRQGEYGKLLQRMGVVDDYGTLNVNEDMWQAATLYLGFAFEKM
ncbi:hypothetical protein PaG_06628 [Moesziomyces aphidis]|uniref:mRNA cap guanine-N(7) methyltransferase n=1 Tax=Moesziomyces aphidis TaxID=84754 RepID=W3VDU2_MOEAP|nr:hypothetical protein PaG_06628 [Moesziomyces aphidis]